MSDSRAWRKHMLDKLSTIFLATFAAYFGLHMIALLVRIALRG